MTTISNHPGSSPGAARPCAVHTIPIAAIAAAMLLISGCAATQTASLDRAASVLAALDAGYRSTPDLALQGTVKASGMPVTIWFDALARRRDSMKVTLIGPFGIPVGAMSATPVRFRFFNADADELIEGRPDRTSFEKLLMIPLDYDELISLLRGEVPALPTEGTYEVRAVGASLIYVASRGDIVEEITVDPTRPAVERYRRSRRADTSKAELEIVYAGFTDLGSRGIARRATVDVSGGAQRLTVTIDEVQSEIPEGESLEIDIPPGTPVRGL